MSEIQPPTALPPVLSSSLAGRVALVTGGSRGIGAATCAALAAAGAAVVVHYGTQQGAAQALAEQIQALGGTAEALGADLAEPAAAGHLVQQTLARFNRLDILVNNAGQYTDGPAVAAMSDDQWERSLAINLTAAFRCARACVPVMKAGSWGRIINITSQAAYTGSANHAHYAAAKAGLAGFTYSLAKEVAPYGITVNMVAPGRILTDMVRPHLERRLEEWTRHTPLGRLGKPEEVAAPIAFLASEAAGYITGATLHVNGGLLMA